MSVVVEHLSTTLAGGFPRCPARALEGHRRRVEDGGDEWSEDHLEFGTAVHNVAELYHQCLARGEDPPDPVDAFYEEWARRSSYDIEYFGLGRSTIADFIDRTLFHREGETISTELHFAYDVKTGEIMVPAGLSDNEMAGFTAQIRERGGVPVVSKIDRVDRVALGDGRFRIEIYDYKTNRVPFSRSDVEESVQLQIYVMAAQALWPEAESVMACFDMLRFGRFPVEFDEETLDETRQWLTLLWLQIQRDSALEDHPERVNPYCAFCPRRLVCRAYAAVVKGDGGEPQLLVHPSDIGKDESQQEYADRLWDNYAALRDREKLLKKRKDEFSAALSALLLEGDGEIVLDDGSTVYFSPNPRYEYPPEDLWPVLERHGALSVFPQVVSVSKGKLERALRGRVKLLSEVAGIERSYFVSPTISKRKKK